MEKQLSIRSDEAAELAAKLAQQMRKPQKAVVIEALRLLEERNVARQSASAKRKSPSFARFEESMRRMHEEARRIEAETGEKLTSNHDFLYDEYGLPR